MSDPHDPTRAGAGPTPPSGSPTVGPASGAPDAPPTVASSSVYSEPVPTTYDAGPGGPTGPTGPGGPDGGGDDWGPDEHEAPNDRWKVIALVGLAVVVVALIIGGLIVGGGDDDPDDTTTTSSSSTSSSTSTSSTSTSSTSTSTSTTTSSTTTTTAPTTTTAAGPPGAATPEAAAASLFNAWTAGDEANAGQFADPGAVTTLFARDGVGNDLEFDGCTAAGDNHVCTYSNSTATVVFDVEQVASGYRVTAVSFPGD